MTQYQSEVSNQISYQLTEKDYMASLGLHMGKSRRFIPIITLLIGLLLGISTGSLMAATIFSVGFILYIGLLLWIVGQSMKRSFRNTPQLQVEQIVQFDHDGLAFHNRYVLSKVSWQIYQRYEVNTNYYLLYQTPQMFNIIPKSAFLTEEQEYAFRMLLEINVKPGKSVKRKPPIES